MKLAKKQRNITLGRPQKSLWERWKFALISMTAIIGTILATFAGLGYYAAKTVEVECLARRLDTNLDMLGTLKGESHLATFKKQVEAAARVHIKKHAEHKETLCPQGKMMSKVQWVRQWLTGSWESSQRMQIIRPIAENAIRGNFQYEWPVDYGCVNEYRASKIRWPLFGATKVGTIGNMSLYCTNDKGA